MTSLAGSHVLITGGSLGIGAAVAAAARDRGATVSIIARGVESLELTAATTGARWRSADVRDAAALARAVDELTAEAGPIDVLVCCAGIALPGRFLEVPLSEFRDQLDLNYLGTVTALKVVLPAMVARGSGHVALTSSTAGLMGVVGYTGYGPTKWAIRGLAETLRYEVAPRGVRVTVLYPPDTDTPGFALENTRKPPETVAVSGAIRPVSPRVVATALMRGLEKNRDNIAVDVLTKLLIRWGGLLEPLVRGSLKKTIAKALAASAMVVAIATTLSGCFLLPHEPSAVPTGAASSDFTEYFAQSVDWAPCGDLECATISVPIDWTDSTSGSASIALAKQSAVGSPRGTIFVNPGGPGGSGVDFVPYAVSAQLAANFDVIGWDPRGVGASTPVTCLSDSAKDASLYGTYPEPYGTQGWIDDLQAQLTTYAAACKLKTGALLGHVDTVSTANDLELMRALIDGEKPLTYLGYSYGTFIGAVYAELFPSHVGAFVLDGAVDPTVGAFDELVVQAKGFEDNLRAYMTDCLTMADCPFTGTVDQALQQAHTLMGSVDGAGLISADGRTLDSATVGTGVVTALYSSDNWPFLTRAFAGLKTGEVEPMFRLADSYNDRNRDGSYSSNAVEVYQATTCEDTDWTADPASTLDRLAQISAAAPTLGSYLALDDFAVLDTLCNEWPYPAATFPTSFEAAGAAPIVVVGTTNDPATPYVWAQSLAAQFDSGVLVTATGDQHTSYNSGNTCVDDVVDSYFMTGTAPTADVRC